MRIGLLVLGIVTATFAVLPAATEAKEICVTVIVFDHTLKGSGVVTFNVHTPGAGETICFE